MLNTLLEVWILQKLRNNKNDTQKKSSEIRYVSSLIRSKLSNAIRPNCVLDKSLDHDLKTSFWSTCHKLFDAIAGDIPTFDLDTCHQYFQHTVSQCNRMRQFIIPAWIPKLPLPSKASVDNNIGYPSYSQVARTVAKCRPSSSACPIDQLSVIILQHCPILRTLLHPIIQECWVQRQVPNCWKTGGNSSNL